MTGRDIDIIALLTFYWFYYRMWNGMSNSKVKANVIGDGSFGTFLKKSFFKHDPSSNNVVLAVPASAYEEVCAQHKGKHLINVCSVQLNTNHICAKHSKHVTGVHPLFGHRSGPLDRACIVTKTCAESDAIIHGAFGECIIKRMSPAAHDKLMAKTHAVALQIANQYAKSFRNLRADSAFLPASVRRLMDVIYLLDKMPEGTVESIRSNPFLNARD